MRLIEEDLYLILSQVAQQWLIKNQRLKTWRGVELTSLCPCPLFIERNARD